MEERKYEVIKKLVSTCGNKKRTSLALIVIVRTIVGQIKMKANPRDEIS